jgi:putative thioredoxin
MSAFSVDVNRDTFQERVLEASRTVPVLVDFWAEWCAPCRALKPILERLADEHQGRFLLAKIDTEQNSALATQYGVRGIPNVKAFVGGRVVDEFSGALPEPMVREFLKRILPSEADELRIQAMEAHRTGDAEQALTLLDQAINKDPRSELARVAKAQVLLGLDRIPEAKQILSEVSPLARKDEHVARLIARIEFASAAQELPGNAELKRRVRTNPGDLQARLDLAKALICESDYQGALIQLLEIV